MTALTCDEVRDLAPAFVLGALERDEEATVAEHVRDCPDAHAEIVELGSVVPYLDETVPLVEPPASLKGRILAAAAADLEARGAEGAVTALPASRVTAVPTGRAVGPSRPTSPASAGNVVSLDAARARRRDPRIWLIGLAAVF